MCDRCTLPLRTVLSLQATKTGTHFLFDGHNCRTKEIQEPGWLVDTLTHWARELQLTPVAPPRSFIGMGGRTAAAILLLSESHASIHVDVPSRGVHADIFSCRPFDVARARAFCIERLNPERFSDQTVHRRLG